MLSERENVNKHQLQIHARLKGRHAKPYLEDFLKRGLIAWGEGRSEVRPEDPNYARYLTITERGKCWLHLWKLMMRVEDPTKKVNITFRTGSKTP